MKEVQFQGHWDQLTGKIQKKWGKLTNDDIKQAKGNWKILAGKIEERYGVAEEVAEKQVEEFCEKLQEAGEKAESFFNQASATVTEIGEKVQNFSKDYQNFLKEKPIATAAILLAAGALVGMLIAK